MNTCDSDIWRNVRRIKVIAEQVGVETNTILLLSVTQFLSPNYLSPIWPLVFLKTNILHPSPFFFKPNKFLSVELCRISQLGMRIEKQERKI
jgi:hypothetical protein